MTNAIAAGTSGVIGNPALGPGLQGFLGTPGATGFFAAVIPAAIGIAFVIGTLIFFAMLILGAIAWISSGGDKQKLEEARGRITNALIGLILLFASYAIIRLIETFFGIHILTLDITSLAIP